MNFLDLPPEIINRIFEIKRKNHFYEKIKHLESILKFPERREDYDYTAIQIKADKYGFLFICIEDSINVYFIKLIPEKKLIHHITYDLTIDNYSYTSYI